MSDEINILRNKLAREQEKLKVLETEVERKTRNLYQTFEQQEKVLSTLNEFIVITDKEFKVKYFNQKASLKFKDIQKSRKNNK